MVMKIIQTKPLKALLDLAVQGEREGTCHRRNDNLDLCCVQEKNKRQKACTPAADELGMMLTGEYICMHMCGLQYLSVGVVCCIVTADEL